VNSEEREMKKLLNFVNEVYNSIQWCPQKSVHTSELCFSNKKIENRFSGVSTSEIECICILRSLSFLYKHAISHGILKRDMIDFFFLILEAKITRDAIRIELESIETEDDLKGFYYFDYFLSIDTHAHERMFMFEEKLHMIIFILGCLFKVENPKNSMEYLLQHMIQTYVLKMPFDEIDFGKLTGSMREICGAFLKEDHYIHTWYTMIEVVVFILCVIEHSESIQEKGTSNVDSSFADVYRTTRKTYDFWNIHALDGVKWTDPLSHCEFSNRVFFTPYVWIPSCE
jgi:hypothetical protein